MYFQKDFDQNHVFGHHFSYNPVAYKGGILGRDWIQHTWFGMIGVDTMGRRTNEAVAWNWGVSSH